MFCSFCLFLFATHKRSVQREDKNYRRQTKALFGLAGEFCPNSQSVSIDLLHKRRGVAKDSRSALGCSGRFI